MYLGYQGVDHLAAVGILVRVLDAAAAEAVEAAA